MPTVHALLSNGPSGSLLLTLVDIFSDLFVPLETVEQSFSIEENFKLGTLPSEVKQKKTVAATVQFLHESGNSGKDGTASPLLRGSSLLR